MYDKEIMYVTSCGRAFRLKSALKNKIGEITYTINKQGYIVTSISGKAYKLHRLVLMTYKPIPNHRDMQVNHIDGDKTNNSLLNLEWCDSKHNIRHAWKTGLSFSSEEKTEKRRKSQLKQAKIDNIFNPFSLTEKKSIKGILKTRKMKLSDYYFVRVKMGKTRITGYAIEKLKVEKHMDVEEIDSKLRVIEKHRTCVYNTFDKTNLRSLSGLKRVIINSNYDFNEFKFIKVCPNQGYLISL